jgi:hypothetical protein
MKLIRVLLLLLCVPVLGRAQHLLQQKLDFQAREQELGTVLQQLGRSAHCSFSYNSNILKEDKKVSIHAHQQSLSAILEQLLGEEFQYREQDQYIIIRQAAKSFTISGYVRDGQTGTPISDAVVYESNLLASTQTNEQGYFRLAIRAREKYTTAQIAISKDHYHVRSMQIDAGYDQEIIVPIIPAESELDNVVIESGQKVENSWLGKLLLSTNLKEQSRNIGNFISRRPVQTSIIPGFGTHGKLGAQIVNQFSLNIIGGYTAGVNGVELGNVFNIVKGDMAYLQIAGVFNMVGGRVTGLQIGNVFNHDFSDLRGVQISGIYNYTQDSVQGVQIAGLGNIASGNMQGGQISGLLNILREGSMNGFQVAGLLNWVSGPVQDSGRIAFLPTSAKGIQISGLGNIVTGSMRGGQVSGLQNIVRKGDLDGFQLTGLYNWVSGAAKGIQVCAGLNRARTMRGFQLAVINIADTLDGYSLGLVNYVRSGYHTLSIYATEIQGFNLSYKSGNPLLYSIIAAGAALDNTCKSYSVGYGFGNRAKLHGPWVLQTEVLVQGYYLGDWEQLPVSVRLQPVVSYKFNKTISCFAGPSFTLLTNKRSNSVAGYLSDVSDRAPYLINMGSTVSGWFGFQAGISLF